MNTSDDRAQLLKSIERLRKLHHINVHSVWGACIEGSPNTPDGVEMLVATGSSHFHVTLYRLLRWTRENNPQVTFTSLFINYKRLT